MDNGTDVISGVIGYDVYRLTSGGEVLDGMDFCSVAMAENFISKRAKEVRYYSGCIYKTIDGILQNADHLFKD